MSGPFFRTSVSSAGFVRGIYLDWMESWGSGRTDGRFSRVDVFEGFVKILLIVLTLIGVPILFILVFDIAAHLGELFGRD